MEAINKAGGIVLDNNPVEDFAGVNCYMSERRNREHEVTRRAERTIDQVRKDTERKSGEVCKCFPLCGFQWDASSLCFRW